MNRLKGTGFKSPPYSPVERVLLVVTALAFGALVVILGNIAHHKGMQGFEEMSHQMREWRQ